MELHRFEVHVNDGDVDGSQDADVHLEGPANEKKFADVFDSDYIGTPRGQPEESLQRVASSAAPNGDRSAQQRMYPRGYGGFRGGGGRGGGGRGRW